jgi:hypothetical protein
MPPRVLLPLLALLLAAAPARAQLAGVVTDADTGAPVWGADVRLVLRHLATSTDGAGRFWLPAGAAGTDTLEVRRLGFRPARIVLTGSVGGVDVALSVDTMMVAALEIVGRPSRAGGEGMGGIPVRDPRRPGEPGRSSGAWSALAALEDAVSLQRTTCVPAPEGGVYRECVWIRGVPTPLQVFVDEAPAPRGVVELATLSLHEVYRMTYDAATAVVWVETNAFVEARALAYLAARGR